MTVFDPSTLHRLLDDGSGRTFVLDLAANYRRILPQRVARLVRAVATDDVDETLEAALSLKVSSAMCGAHELAEAARVIEDDVRRGDVTRGSIARLARPRRRRPGLDGHRGLPRQPSPVSLPAPPCGSRRRAQS